MPFTCGIFTGLLQGPAGIFGRYHKIAIMVNIGTGYVERPFVITDGRCKQARASSARP